MAYTVMSTQVSGYLVTATDWNYIVNNFAAGVPDIFTTAGDTVYATAADTAARLGIGSYLKILRVNSGATAPEWVYMPTMLKTQRGTTQTNSSAEVTLISYTLLGGLLSTDNHVVIHSYLQQAVGSAGNITWRLKYGGTTVGTATASSVSANTSVVLDAVVSGSGATNTQAGGIISSVSDEYGSGTAAIDSGVNQTLAVTIQMATASAGNTWTEYLTTIEFVPNTSI